MVDKTYFSVVNPADTRRRINVGLTLIHRLRRWTNVEPTLIRCLVPAGKGIRVTASRDARHYSKNSVHGKPINRNHTDLEAGVNGHCDLYSAQKSNG